MGGLRVMTLIFHSMRLTLVVMSALLGVMAPKTTSLHLSNPNKNHLLHRYSPHVTRNPRSPPPAAEKSDWSLNSPLFGSSLEESPDLAEPASCIMRAAKAAQAHINVPSLRLEATAGSLAAQDHATMAALRKGVLADLSPDGVEFLLRIIDFLKGEKVDLDAELRSRNEECSKLRAANLEKDQQLSLLRGWLVEESISLSLHLKGAHR